MYYRLHSLRQLKKIHVFQKPGKQATRPGAYCLAALFSSFSLLTCSALILCFINFSDSASRTLFPVSGTFPVVSPASTLRGRQRRLLSSLCHQLPLPTTYGDESLSHWPLVPPIFVKSVIVRLYSICNFLSISHFGFVIIPLFAYFSDLFIPAQSNDPIDLSVLHAFIRSFIAHCISLVSCVCLIFPSRFSSLGFQRNIYLGFLKHTFEYSTLLCCVSQSSLVFGICHE